MGFFTRLFLSSFAACVVAILYLLSDLGINYPLCFFIYSIVFSVLTYFYDKNVNGLLANNSIKKDLEFGIYVIGELRNVKPTYLNIRCNKLRKLEELMIGCQCVLDERHDAYRDFAKHLGTINMWESTFSNQAAYELKDYNKALSTLKTFLETQVKKR